MFDFFFIMKAINLTSQLCVIALFLLSMNGCKKDETKSTDKPLSVGDDYQGGIVAYLFKSGDSGYVEGQTHGIVVSRRDQSTSMIWGCWSTSITGADFSDLGKGDDNTKDIIAGCSSNDIAARICSNYEANTYTDWFLPSKDELNKLYLNKKIIQDLDNANRYWSSTESNANEAWIQDYLDGHQSSHGKLAAAHVRAIRNF